MLVFELCENQTYQATATFGGNGDEYVLTGEEFSALGPATQDIVVHAEGTNFTSGFNYAVALQYKLKNGPWTGTDLISNQTSGTYKISDVFNDRSKFGMAMRLVLRTQLANGASGTQHGDMNISVAVRLFT